MLSLFLAAAMAAEVDVVVRTHGSGDPIEGAVVTLHGQPLGATDRRGRVTLDLDPASTFSISHPEHRDAIVTLEGLAPAQFVFLEARPAALEVVVESFRPSAHTSRHAIDAEMALETPGALDDSVRLVQSMLDLSLRRRLDEPELMPEQVTEELDEPESE